MFGAAAADWCRSLALARANDRSYHEQPFGPYRLLRELIAGEGTDQPRGSDANRPSHA